MTNRFQVGNIVKVKRNNPRFKYLAGLTGSIIKVQKNRAYVTIDLGVMGQLQLRCEDVEKTYV
jgi:hypothetical protein